MSPPNRPPSTATPSASASTDRSRTDRSRADSRLSRRTFIAAGSTTALASLAGCSAVVDFLADLALQDVNVFNGADEPVSGSIEILDSDGETVLEETFDLEEAPEDEETDEDNESTAFYDEVWTDAGDYEVTVALDEPIGDEDESDEGDESDEAEPDDENGDTAANETDSSDGTEPDGTAGDDDSADGDAGAENETEAGGDEADDGDGDGDGDSDDADDDDSQTGPSNTDTVTIDDVEEEKLVVGIAQEGPAELLSFHVIEDFSDLEDEFEE